MVVFDTSFLCLAFDSSWKPPLDPATGQPLERARERIDYLISGLSKSNMKVLIPSPVLAEYLVRGGIDKSERLAIFTSSKAYQVAPFDTKAAVECSQIEDGDSGRKHQLEEASKAKVKFDRQVISIAKATRAKIVYTGDHRLAKVAARNGLKAVMTWELPLPPGNAQMSIAYEA
jgi:hypothetical protein